MLAKLVYLAFLHSVTIYGAFSPTGGVPLRISPNSAFRPVSRTGSTPVSSAGASAHRDTPLEFSKVPPIASGAVGMIVPQLSALSAPSMSDPAHVSGAMELPHSAAAISFNPGSRQVQHQEVAASGLLGAAFGLPQAWSAETTPAPLSLSEHVHRQAVAAPGFMGGAPFGMPPAWVPETTPVPGWGAGQVHHQQVAGAGFFGGAPFGMPQAWVPEATPASAWVPGHGSARRDGPMFAKKRRVMGSDA